MVQIDVEYIGDLHCEVIHGPSGADLLTDAPVDNQGKGEYFSPTDLVAASAASCVATIMGILAKRHHLDITGLRISVQKDMVEKPVRRIGKLSFDIVFPQKLSDKDFQLLCGAVNSCPVAKSLHPDVKIETKFRFAE